MSANITIKEGGGGKIFNAIKKLKIADIGGGTSLWIPENEAQLTTKNIAKNGTYKAKDDGKYGYSEITVNVPKKTSTSGKKPDGNDYNVETDPNGNIIETKLPSIISLTTNPTKMTYSVGDSIDMTGAVVKAYCGDGTLWEATGYTGGVIPLSEINVSPTTVSDSAGRTASSDLLDFDVPIANRFIALTNNPIYFVEYSGPSMTGALVKLDSEDGYQVVMASANDDYSFTRGNDTYDSATIKQYGWMESYTYNNKKVYYTERTGSYFGNQYPFVQCAPDYAGQQLSKRADARFLAWTMIYGTQSGGQEITLSWNRPNDSKKLTTKFNVTVS